MGNGDPYFGHTNLSTVVSIFYPLTHVYCIGHTRTWFERGMHLSLWTEKKVVPRLRNLDSFVDLKSEVKTSCEIVRGRITTNPE